MVIYNSIGYFTLELSAFLPLVLCDLHIWILYILSLCYAIPSPLVLYQNTGLSVSLLVLFPATSPSVLFCEGFFQDKVL
jgi:hypothetical protein